MPDDNVACSRRTRNKITKQGNNNQCFQKPSSFNVEHDAKPPFKLVHFTVISNAPKALHSDANLTEICIFLGRLPFNQVEPIYYSTMHGQDVAFNKTRWLVLQWCPVNNDGYIRVTTKQDKKSCFCHFGVMTTDTSLYYNNINAC